MEITAKKTSTPTFVTCMSSIEVEESLLKQCSGLGEEKEKGRGGGEKRRGEEEGKGGGERMKREGREGRERERRGGRGCTRIHVVL